MSRAASEEHELIESGKPRTWHQTLREKPEIPLSILLFVCLS